MNRSIVFGEKTAWVWKKRAPAENFSSNFRVSASKSPSGEVAAPGRMSVGPERSFPERSVPPLRRVMARMSSGVGRSKTGLASG